MTSAKKDKLNIHFNSEEMSELESVLFETPEIPNVPTVDELMQQKIETDKIINELEKIDTDKINHNNTDEIAQGIKLRWWQLKAMDDIFTHDNPYKPFYDMYLNDLSYIYKCIINNSQN